jgi:hypothetical protein
MRDPRWMIVVAKVLLLSVALVVVQGVGSRFLPAMEEGGGAPEGVDAGQPGAQQSAGFLGLVLLVGLLQTAALAYPVVRSRWHGWRLALAIFVVYFGTASFMGQIESAIYLAGKMPPGMQSGLFLMGLFTGAVFSPLLVLTLGRWRQAAPARGERNARPKMSAASWAWRLAAGAAVMLALYYLFGYYVAWQSPSLREYYGGSDPGTFLAQMRGIVSEAPWMVPLQYVRGLLWVLLALPVIRMMRGRWWEAGVAVSLLFTVPSLYLLLPNPFMPEVVRMTHLVETVPYQFLFGWFVTWLFTRGASSRFGPLDDPLPAGG